MCSLVDWLCATLFCSKRELEEKLRDPQVRHETHQQLSGESFVLTTSHLRQRNRYVKFSGWCPRPARSQFAYNGKGRVTVELHMLCCHKLQLRYANLLCVKSSCNEKHVDYFPLECLRVHRKGPIDEAKYGLSPVLFRSVQRG
jgi:hypothetical protein